MTNRKWVLLLHVFTRSFHQSCWIAWPTVCEWHCFILVPGMLINHVASHDQQQVSDTASFVCQAFSHQSCYIPWLTASEWHCFISLPGILINHVSSHDQQEVSVTASIYLPEILINHVSSHDQQEVSDTVSFVWQAVSSIMLDPMTNSLWVTLLHLFAMQAHQSCCIHDQQLVSDTAWFVARQAYQSCCIP